MAAIRKNESGSTEKISAAGITFRLYQPEDLEVIPREKLIELLLEEQTKLREAVGIIREQERMLGCMQERIDLNQADRYGSKSETSGHLKGKSGPADSMGNSDDKATGLDRTQKYDGIPDGLHIGRPGKR